MLPFCIDTSASLSLLPDICANCRGRSNLRKERKCKIMSLIHLSCLQSNLLVQVGKYLALTVAEHPCYPLREAISCSQAQ